MGEGTQFSLWKGTRNSGGREGGGGAASAGAGPGGPCTVGNRPRTAAPGSPRVLVVLAQPQEEISPPTCHEPLPWPSLVRRHSYRSRQQVILSEVGHLEPCISAHLERREKLHRHQVVGERQLFIDSAAWERNAEHNWSTTGVCR